MSQNALHPAIDQRLREIQSSATHLSPDAIHAGLTALHGEVARCVETLKCRLLGTTLAWDDAQNAEAAWIHETNQRLAALSLQLTECLRRQVGADDSRTLHAIAVTLLCMGDTMKWDGVASARAPRDYRALNGLMRQALSTDHQRDPISAEAGGRSRPCTLESLYFRALLLARFASGTLSCKQIEILDEWLWIWSPALQGSPEAPAGSPLRADLDSGEGLRQGPRADGGPALYLPQGPLDAAFAALVAQFQEGMIVPAEGCTAAFRIEEHISVLDLVRRELRTAKLAPEARAVRQATERKIELYVGIGDITSRGFLAAAPKPAAIVLAAKDGVSRTQGRMERERDTALGGIYDPTRRLVNLTNVSDTGFGLEGSQVDCGSLAVGDLVGMRISPSEKLVIGKVTRCIPAATSGRVIVGIRRISSDARLVDVSASASRSTRDSAMLYVPGNDGGGGHDAYLVGERTFEEGGALEVPAGDNLYRFRFNRVRERGRGWVLAGFEILAARPARREAASG